MANRWNRWSTSGRVGGGSDRWTHTQGDYAPVRSTNYWSHAGKALAAGAAGLGLKAVARAGGDAYNYYMRGGRSSSSRGNKRRASSAYSRKAYDRWAYSDPPAGSGRIPRAALSYASRYPDTVVSGVAGKYSPSVSRFGGPTPVGKYFDLSILQPLSTALGNPNSTTSLVANAQSLVAVPTLTDGSNPGIQSSRATGSLMVDEIHLSIDLSSGLIPMAEGYSTALSKVRTGFYNCTVEYFVVLDLQCNGSLPALTDMLSGAAYQHSYVDAFEKPENGFRFRTLHRAKRAFVLDVEYVTTADRFVFPTETLFEEVHLSNLAIPIEFTDDSTSGAVSTMKSANIVFFAVSTINGLYVTEYTQYAKADVRGRVLFHDLH